MRKTIRIVIWISVVMLTLSACGKSNKSETAQFSQDTRATSPISVLPTAKPASPVATPVPAEATPTVSPGRSAVTGHLISQATGEPLGNVVIRLAEVYYPEGSTSKEDGAYALDNAFSPSAMTNQEGYFRFPDVEARDYVIFVGDIYVKYLIVVNEKGTPKIWTAPENGVLDIGDLVVNY